MLPNMNLCIESEDEINLYNNPKVSFKLLNSHCSLVAFYFKF